MNRHIIVAVVVTSGVGIARAWTSKKHITPIIIGSYVFLLVLAVMDAVGGLASQLASALAMLVTVYVILGSDPQTKQPNFPWQELISFAQGKVSGPSGAPGTTQPIIPGSSASH